MKNLYATITTPLGTFKGRVNKDFNKLTEEQLVKMRDGIQENVNRFTSLTLFEALPLYNTETIIPEEVLKKSVICFYITA